MQLGHPWILRTVPVLLCLCTLTAQAQTRYSGGLGTAEDPYQIATAADLIALGETTKDYGSHFVMTADINLAPSLPGGRTFVKAVIAATARTSTGTDTQEPRFAGVFDGQGHAISQLTIMGSSYLGLFGRIGAGGSIRNLLVLDANIVASDGYAGGIAARNAGMVTNCRTTGSVGGPWDVGGLVGENCLDGRSSGVVTSCSSAAVVAGGSYTGGIMGRNSHGQIIQCCSSGAVAGSWFIGGLVGYNDDEMVQCYSLARADGKAYVGGLAGCSYGTVTQCYAAGRISGSLGHVGGLTGYSGGSVTACFWNVQTSGLAWSGGGEGKSTAQMQTADTFLSAGWDLGLALASDIQGTWRIDEGKDYPHLSWEVRTH
jgi:hypothetical protein